MKEFLEVADGKLLPKFVSETLYTRPLQSKIDKKRARINSQNEQEITCTKTIEAKDNPLTQTNRLVSNNNKSQRSINVASDYI